ncbi:hypothetical protein BC628DRAFT_1417781 [Trametes gibbosa]|nr:hypothetical protein BC628DRAFT_1421816 [Trametes gibbosa]KAI0828192.1 hypothetical protein BC628DRAFT_1417781 [Trametes gibbosa]
MESLEMNAQLALEAGLHGANMANTSGDTYDQDYARARSSASSVPPPTTSEARSEDDNNGFVAAYGLASGEALNQEFGDIVAAEDKCVAFPNIYQHRVAPFGLIDRTKPGHRKILAFFLVDPTITILSTTRVPPQQAEWYEDAVAGAERNRGFRKSSSTSFSSSWWRIR